MANGQNAMKHGNTDKQWWGKRPLSYYEVSHKSKVNKKFKRLLHKKERQEAMRKLNDDIDTDFKGVEDISFLEDEWSESWMASKKELDDYGV